MIKKEEVRHIAKLARMGINKKEEDEFQKELSLILDYFGSLQEVDVYEVRPIFHPSENFLEKKPEKMREDKEISKPKELVDKLIEAAPNKEGRYIKVKAVF